MPVLAAFENIFILKCVFINFILAIAFSALLIAIFLRNTRNISIVNVSATSPLIITC